MTRIFYCVAWCLCICQFAFSQTLHSGMNANGQYDNSAKYIHDWNMKITDIIMNDGFSPPVISRIYTYCNLAAYQAAHHGFSEYNSLEGQINELKTMPAPEADKEYRWDLCAVEAYHEMTNSLLYRGNLSDSMYEAQRKEIAAQGVSEEVMQRSKKFGEDMAKAFRIWYKHDGYTRNQGRPRYVFSRSPGKWIPTPPAFADPLDPYFNTMRHLTLDSVNQFRAVPPFLYSTDIASAFYQQNIVVYNFSKTLTAEQKEIALFWDCNPIKTWHNGHFVFNTQMISPGGHWVNIAKIACKKLKKPMMESLEAYTKLSVGLYDAFLVCWNDKYIYNYIRPITFIHEKIDSEWEPLLQTPPFPEHTSGHSTISATSAQILTNTLGEVAFEDDTEIRFGYPIRKFPNFLAAALEASNSRIWGGIHYPLACNEGNRIGKLIGNYVTKKLVLRKMK